MSYIRGFIPWIVFGVVSSFGWQWGASAALLIGIGLLLHARSAGVALDAQVLEISTVVFFAVVTVLAFALPHSPVRHYAGVMSFGWLALTAWGTLAIRHPFTLGIARRSTPQEFWQSPLFLSINNVITRAWAISFTLTGAAIALCVATGAGTAAATTCQVLGFVVPAVFTSRYPKIATARFAATL